MREILFRGKRVDNGEWVEGYFCKKYFQELPHDRCVIQYKTKYDPKMWKSNYMAAEVIPESITEFTGLTDKNGTKIFEGDIIKGFWNTVFVVYWDDCYLQFRARKSDGHEREIDYYGESKDLEVIGNVHDNPELLTEN